MKARAKSAKAIWVRLLIVGLVEPCSPLNAPTSLRPKSSSAPENQGVDNVTIHSVHVVVCFNTGGTRWQLALLVFIYRPRLELTILFRIEFFAVFPADSLERITEWKKELPFPVNVRSSRPERGSRYFVVSQGGNLPTTPRRSWCI
jgi:hypothetical protein